MTWYLQHQRAQQIVAEHERQAEQIRLARLAMDAPAPTHSHRAGFVRRTVARPIALVGRSATRLAVALDAERRPAARPS